MRRLLMVPALGVVGLALAAPASAQLVGIEVNRPSYTDEGRQPYNESLRVAYDNGYREGIKEGERDARSRDVFNYQDERTWQRADKGYHRSYGDSGRYQQSFRSGYSNWLLGRLPPLRAKLRLRRHDISEHARRLRLSAGHLPAGRLSPGRLSPGWLSPGRLSTGGTTGRLRLPT